ncbi:MAG: ribosome biogenesis/translation initiation ATPase RLI [Candidatus Hodarchaeota archaeon]
MRKVYKIDYSRCSNSTCGRPCIEKCPIVISNKTRKKNQKKVEEPIRFKASTEKIIIKEEFCIKCGICANVCPLDAVYTMNVLEEDTSQVPTHRYQQDEGIEGFRLYGLPTLMPGRVTGLCGPNGIGKTTMLNILSGTLKPNFGHKHIQEENYWNVFLDSVKENELREHFSALYKDDRVVAYKQQVLKILFEKYKGKTILDILEGTKKIDDGFFNSILDNLDIHSIKDRFLEQCSGGELQRFALALVLISDADVYLIDEPCTFLDVKKRIELADLLQERAGGNGSGKQYPVLVVEHDLAILDYLSDVVHLFYGVPHQFGILTRVQSNKAGINSYLDGFVKAENVQFRAKKIGFKRTIGGRTWDNARIFTSYGRIQKTFDSFKLTIEPGTMYFSEILGVVGENGLGKSTFAKILAGELQPDPGSEFSQVNALISYKPQYITRDYGGTVKQFIMERSQNYDFGEQMLKTLYMPVGVDRLFDKEIEELSGGELQRVFICSCLAKKADLYILDEPSAYLDVEERLHISSIIRANTKRSYSTTICIEHDIQIADALADRLMIFKGKSGVEGTTIGPLNKREGMNQFLEILGITFRRDPNTGRARINKKGSQKDKFQRSTGEYFYMS